MRMNGREAETRQIRRVAIIYTTLPYIDIELVTERARSTVGELQYRQWESWSTEDVTVITITITGFTSFTSQPDSLNTYGPTYFDFSTAARQTTNFEHHGLPALATQPSRHRMLCSVFVHIPSHIKFAILDVVTILHLPQISGRLRITRSPDLRTFSGARDTMI